MSILHRLVGNSHDVSANDFADVVVTVAPEPFWSVRVKVVVVTVAFVGIELRSN